MSVDQIHAEKIKLDLAEKIRTLGERTGVNIPSNIEVSVEGEKVAIKMNDCEPMSFDLSQFKDIL